MSGTSLFRRCVTEDRFQFEEFFQPSLPPFSTVARLFEAPKTTSEVDPRAINMNVAGSNAPGDPACPLPISRGHKPGQSIRGIVRDSDSVVFVFIRDDAKNGSENLLACDSHVIPDVGKHSGLHEVAFCETIRSSGPASNQRCAFFDTNLNQALYLLELRLACQRSDADSIRERIAHFGGLGRQPGRCYDLNHLGSWNQHAGRRVAGLAGVAEAFLHALWDCF